MKIIEAGHVYELDQLDTSPNSDPVMLKFVNREGKNNHPGTQTQEVLRVLINRTQHCQACLDCPEDDEIIYHLRMALLIHESRALKRKLEKKTLEPENIRLGTDGHFLVQDRAR